MRRRRGPAPAAAPPTRGDDRRDRAEARQNLAPRRRRPRAAEALMAKLAAERAAIEARLADPAIYASVRKADVTAANTRLAAIARETAAAEADWLAAEEALESAE